MTNMENKRASRRRAAGRVPRLNGRETSALVLLAQNPTAEIRSKILADLSGPALRIARFFNKTSRGGSAASSRERLAADSLRNWASKIKK
jgi:uncharacterized protein (DUF2235 family)